MEKARLKEKEMEEKNRVRATKNRNAHVKGSRRSDVGIESDESEEEVPKRRNGFEEVWM